MYLYVKHQQKNNEHGCTSNYKSQDIIYETKHQTNYVERVTKIKCVYLYIFNTLTRSK